MSGVQSGQPFKRRSSSVACGRCVGRERGDISRSAVYGLKGSHDGSMRGRGVTADSPPALKPKIERGNCIAETRLGLVPRVGGNRLFKYTCVCPSEHALVRVPGYLWVRARSINKICDLEAAGCTCQIEIWGCSVIFM